MISLISKVFGVSDAMKMRILRDDDGEIVGVSCSSASGHSEFLALRDSIAAALLKAPADASRARIDRRTRAVSFA